VCESSVVTGETAARCSLACVSTWHKSIKVDRSTRCHVAQQCSFVHECLGCGVVWTSLTVLLFSRSYVCFCKCDPVTEELGRFFALRPHGARVSWDHDKATSATQRFRTVVRNRVPQQYQL